MSPDIFGTGGRGGMFNVMEHFQCWTCYARAEPYDSIHCNSNINRYHPSITRWPLLVMVIIYEIKKNNSWEIDDVVETHLCKLCVLFLNILVSFDDTFYGFCMASCWKKCPYLRKTSSWSCRIQGVGVSHVWELTWKKIKVARSLSRFLKNFQ